MVIVLICVKPQRNGLTTHATLFWACEGKHLHAATVLRQASFVFTCSVSPVLCFRNENKLPKLLIVNKSTIHIKKNSAQIFLQKNCGINYITQVETFIWSLADTFKNTKITAIIEKCIFFFAGGKTILKELRLPMAGCLKTLCKLLKLIYTIINSATESKTLHYFSFF